MLYLSLIIISAIFSLWLMRKGTKQLPRIIGTLAVSSIVWYVFSFASGAYFGGTIYLLFHILMAIVVGSSITLILWYSFISNEQIRISKIAFSAILGFISSIFIFSTLLQELKTRALFSEKLPFFAVKSFEEEVINPLDGYYAVAYEFNFSDYLKIPDCKEQRIEEFLNSDFVQNYHGPMRIIQHLPDKGHICVAGIEKQKGSETLISFDSGVMYIAFY